MVTTFLTVRRRSRRVVKEIYLCFFFPTLRRNQKCVSTVANTCAKEKYGYLESCSSFLGSVDERSGDE